MTLAQNKKYWRRWSAVARALGWRMSQGRLDLDAVRDGSSDLAAVWQAASSRAAQHYRAVTADDLRHGCHVLALGRDKSHADFSNRDFDKLLNLWGDEKQIIGLLLEPLELAGEIHRANPDLKSRARHLHFITHDCVGSYVAAVAEDLYGTKDWESLPTDALVNLSRTLHARPNALVAGRAGTPLPAAPDLIECPF